MFEVAVEFCLPITSIILLSTLCADTGVRLETLGLCMSLPPSNLARLEWWYCIWYIYFNLFGGLTRLSLIPHLFLLNYLGYIRGQATSSISYLDHFINESVPKIALYPMYIRIYLKYLIKGLQHNITYYYNVITSDGFHPCF